jgi:short-subunit dehydrogenase
MRKNILITGASGGLGRGMAWEFARRGRHLGLCARRGDRLKELREELLAAHPSITVAVRELDVTDHAAVFEVFHSFRAELGSLDRVVVNAGTGEGSPVGTGGFERNLRAVNTNFTAALAQCEAAMEVFREQHSGHLVVISSMSALKGFPGALTAYAAGKAGVLTLAEGIRAEVMGTQVKVSTMLPGYIRSESNTHEGQRRLVVDTETGCRRLAAAIEREPARACVPAWPWSVLGVGLRLLPLRVTSRMGAVARRAEGPRPRTAAADHAG